MGRVRGLIAGAVMALVVACPLGAQQTITIPPDPGLVDAIARIDSTLAALTSELVDLRADIAALSARIDSLHAVAPPANVDSAWVEPVTDTTALVWVTVVEDTLDSMVGFRDTAGAPVCPPLQSPVIGPTSSVCDRRSTDYDVVVGEPPAGRVIGQVTIPAIPTAPAPPPAPPPAPAPSGTFPTTGWGGPYRFARENVVSSGDLQLWGFVRDTATRPPDSVRVSAGSWTHFVRPVPDTLFVLVPGQTSNGDHEAIAYRDGEVIYRIVGTYDPSSPGYVGITLPELPRFAADTIRAPYTTTVRP